MQHTNYTKIIFDKRKLDTVIRLGCPDDVLLHLLKTGEVKKTGDSLIDEYLESMVDVKEFSNWGGNRKNAGRKSKINQDENQLENQDDCNLANKHKHNNNNNNINNKYKINYSVIKLTEKDFNNWQEAYPYLNIRAECMVRNDWLEKQSEEVKKKWFITTAKYFVQQNELRKKQQKEENTLDDNWGRKATYEDFDKFMKDF